MKSYYTMFADDIWESLKEKKESSLLWGKGLKKGDELRIAKHSDPDQILTCVVGDEDEQKDQKVRIFLKEDT